MPKRVSDEQLDKMIEGMLAHLTPHVEVPGVQGVISRCMVAVLPHAARWSAKEWNRGTPANETVQALMGLTANALASELENVDCDLDTKFAAINEFLVELAHNTARILTSKRPDAFATITAEEVGHG